MMGLAILRHQGEPIEDGPEDREILVKAAGKNGLDPGGFGESGDRWSSTVYSVLGNL